MGFETTTAYLTKTSHDKQRRLLRRAMAAMIDVETAITNSAPTGGELLNLQIVRHDIDKYLTEGI